MEPLQRWFNPYTHKTQHQTRERPPKLTKQSLALTKPTNKLQETNLIHTNGSRHQSEKEKETPRDFVVTQYQTLT